MTTPSENIGEATIEVDADTDPASRALREFSRDVNGRLHDIRGRFASESALIGRSLTDAADGGGELGNSVDRLTHRSGRLGSILGSVSGALGGLGASLARVGAAAGSAAPALASVVATTQALAPASATAVTAFVAVKQAGLALQLGMMGVEDSVTAAFDTSEEGAKAFQESLENLSPEATNFAKKVRELAPAFTKVQQSIQNALFKDLDDTLGKLSRVTLGVFQGNLEESASLLNKMAKSAAESAINLADDGTLGQALSGANKGLAHFIDLPGMAVTAIGQLAAAAAPAFDRLASVASDSFGAAAVNLGKAFESGALTESIDTAVNLLFQLGSVLGNVGAIAKNVFGPIQASGGGLIGILEQITSALKEATASKGFQDAILALAGVMGTVAQTVGPLITQALAALGPIFATLGPPVQQLVKDLGSALQPIIAALGPVLASIARAFGALVSAVSPLLPVIGSLVASVLPLVIPIFDALKTVIDALAPVIAQLVFTLSAALAPIIQALAPIVAQLAATIGNQLASVVGILAELILELSPTLIKLGEIFGELITALGPLIQVVADLAVKLLNDLMPFIEPLIQLVGELAAIFADELAAIIRTVVIPAIQLIVALLQGDFSGALEAAKRLVRGIIDTFVRWFSELPGRIWGALSSLAERLSSRMREAGQRLAAATAQKIAETVTQVKQLPGKAAAALGDLGSRLYKSGQSLVRGFISGIKSMLGAVGDAASSVAKRARDFFPFSPAKEGPFSGRGWTLYSGQAVGDSLADGLMQRAEVVGRAARSVAATAQGAIAATVESSAVAGPAAAVGGLVGPTVVSPATAPVFQVTLSLTNQGVIGSQFELENWLVKALENVDRMGRLPRSLTAVR